MSTLANIFFKKETLQKLVEVLNAKNENGISIDISINEETNDYGQNLTGYVSQTKEQREEKKPRFYVGNGKVFWTDGKIQVATKKENAPQQPIEGNDDLPF